MTISINMIEKYAETRKTTVLAYKIADDYKSATFVLESGHKLTMTEDELKAAIEKYQREVGSDGGAVAPPPDERPAGTPKHPRPAPIENPAYIGIGQEPKTKKGKR